MFLIFIIIYIITISLLILNVGLVSFFKTNHYKNDKPVGCFILNGGIKYIKRKYYKKHDKFRIGVVGLLFLLLGIYRHITKDSPNT